MCCRLRVLLKKEILLFINDKVGLALMFLMPILLVFIITIIQNNAFSMLEGKQLKMMVVNQDEGALGKKVVQEIDNTAMFDLRENSSLTMDQLQGCIISNEVLVGIYIPKDFSKILKVQNNKATSVMLANMGMPMEEVEAIVKSKKTPQIYFVHDPTLQESYSFSILNVIKGVSKGVELEELVSEIYTQMGMAEVPEDFAKNLKKENIHINRVVALSKDNVLPNASQHNVPAWTVFAMFFMVVSLGTNIVSERNSGSFLRIKTLPTDFSHVIFAKQVVYFLIALLQVTVIFGIGYLIFPHIGLPELHFPQNIPGLILITGLCCIAAISYAVMVGSVMRTPDQANGFGAISIIIFATFGGVWVPLFVLPEFMQKISVFSPLHWCIEGFYILFLKDGNWLDILKITLYLFTFSFICQTIAYLSLRKKITR